MEEQRLAACAEKLKRLNEKHRQIAESKSASAQITNDDSETAREETSLSAPAPVPSPVPSVTTQSQATIMQAPLPERVDRDRERMERERERVEPNAEDEVHLPRQPSPPVQRSVAVVPEPHSEGESSLAEVSPLMEENQADRTAVPIRDYFNIEDNRGEQAQRLTFVSLSGRISVIDLIFLLSSLQWMNLTCLCRTWTPPVVRRSLWLPHRWREKQQRLCVPLSPQAIPNSFKSLCHLVSSDSRQVYLLLAS